MNDVKHIGIRRRLANHAGHQTRIPSHPIKAGRTPRTTFHLPPSDSVSQTGSATAEPHKVAATMMVPTAKETQPCFGGDNGGWPSLIGGSGSIRESAIIIVKLVGSQVGSESGVDPAQAEHLTDFSRAVAVAYIAIYRIQQ
jgi:hypothetical protein